MRATHTQHGISRRQFLAEFGAGVAACAVCSACRGATADAREPKEAAFYTPLDGKAVRCELCPRRCVVPDGKRGYCGVRENRGGKYYTLVYGYPCTQNVDPVEKKPLFHVHPGTKAFSIATVGCNFECKFCQNWDISQAEPDEVNPRLEYVASGEIARRAANAGAKTIAYTYSEPTVFNEYVADCARAGRDLGLGNVVVSNGFIAEAPLKALAPLLTAMKVDLKAFTDSFYRDICQGQLQPVLDTLKRLSAAGVWHEIVVLLIPTLNDKPDELKRMADWIVKELGPNVPVHFSRYHPQYKMRNIPPTPPDTLRNARRIALEAGCRFVYLGNVPGDEGQNTYCPSCKAVVIGRYGYVITENQLKNGKCGKCGAAIPGVWG